MKQKYTWKKLIVVGIVFCFLLSIFSMPFQKYHKYGYQFEEVQSKTKLVNEQKTSIDCVFLGDSQGWSTYSPIQLYKEHGFTSLNLCTPGQFMYDTYVLLKNTYKKQKPKLVVIDANMMFSFLNPLKFILLQNFPIFHYHNIDTNKISEEYFARKGFNEYEGVVGYAGSLDYMNFEERNTLSTQAMQYLDKINQLCEEYDSKLLLVNTVSPLVWSNVRHEIIQKWCDDNDVNYVDYNTSEQLGAIDFDFNNDFRDGGDHVNLNGSKKICENLGNFIKQNYALEDHRKDSSYQEWNALAQDASEYD